MANPNPSPATRLKPGDPRINRNGRPKSFDALRALAQQIAHEEALNEQRQPIVINGRKVTTAEAILRRWFASKDAKLQMHAMEIAFGKVPQPVQMTGADGGPVEIQTFDYGAAIASIATGPVPDSIASGNGQGNGHGPTVGENGHGR